MRINAFGVLFLALWFIALRARVERLREECDAVPAPVPVASAI
jgi:hypothetical protein